jgi:rare lipoprotein A
MRLGSLAVLALLGGCAATGPAVSPSRPAAGAPAPVRPTPRPITIEVGEAAYYSARFHGRPTASGERFDMHAFTAAHRTLPFGAQCRVTNRRNSRSVVVRINDRGPWTHGRIIDVSLAVAQALDFVRLGHVPVIVEVLSLPTRAVRSTSRP